MVLGIEATDPLGVGVGLLLALALLKYSGYVDAVKKELGYLASGAIFLLLSAVVMTASEVPGISLAVGYINLIFIVIGFLLVLIAAVLMAIQIFSKLR